MFKNQILARSLCVKILEKKDAALNVCGPNGLEQNYPAQWAELLEI